MNTHKLIIVMLICMFGFTGIVEAQFVRKGGSYLLKKLGREVAEESAEQAGKRVIAKSTRTAGRLVTRSAARSAAGHGSRQLIPKATTSLVTHYGDDALKLAGKASARDLRRMSMLVDDIPAGQRSKLMTFLSGRKDAGRVIDWLYQHRAELITGGLVTTLILRPEEVVGAASDSAATIIDATGRSMVAPIAAEAAKPIGHWLGFTCFATGMVAVSGWLVRRWRTPSAEAVPQSD